MSSRDVIEDVEAAIQSLESRDISRARTILNALLTDLRGSYIRCRNGSVFIVETTDYSTTMVKRGKQHIVESHYPLVSWVRLLPKKSHFSDASGYAQLRSASSSELGRFWIVPRELLYATFSYHGAEHDYVKVKAAASRCGVVRNLRPLAFLGYTENLYGGHFCDPKSNTKICDTVVDVRYLTQECLARASERWVRKSTGREYVRLHYVEDVCDLLPY